MSANCMKAKMLSAALFAALVLSAMQSVRADEATFEVTWLGKNNMSWTDSGVWDSATPEAWQTAIINSSSLIKFKAGNGETVVSNIVVGANVSPTFQRADSATTGQHLLVQEMNGAGTLKLNRVGIHADYSHYDTCNISVAKIEAVANGDNDSWFDGGTASGKRMVVNSDITVNGFLKVYKQTTLAGETMLAGKLLMVDEAVVVNNLVYAGDDATIDSASKGSVGRLTIRSGILSPSALPTGVTFGSLVLDGGTVSVGDGTALPASGLSLGVLSGGYIALTISDADFAAGGTPAYPSGLTFGNDADLSKVVAVVKNASGDAQKKYAITKTGEAYSFAELVPTDSVKWIGGVDDHWETADNWIYGAVPTEGQSVVFEQSAHIYIEKGTTTPRIATMTIGRGAVVKIETTDEWGWENEPVILFEEITGEGTLALKHASLRAARSTDRSVVNCAELQILSHANNDIGRSSRIWGNKENLKSEVEINADITGSGTLVLRYGVRLAGDNSRFAGHVRFVAVADSWSMGGEKYFCVPEAAFTSASKCELQGRFHVLFNEGTLKFGNVAITESYGTGLYVPYGAAAIVIEIAEGEIRDNYQGLGIGVYTRSEGSDYVEGATVGCAGVTIKKVGDGSLVYGMTKAHSLVVEGGHVEFTGENNNGDDSDVNVTVKAGASIGSSESLGCGWDNDTQSYKNGFVGGDVTVRHQFTFEPGAAIKQEYIATTTTDEQTQEETTTYSMRKLTIARDVDLANVVFGVTNPEALPAVTKALTQDGTPRFTMFAANSLIGTVATENGGYTPTGSEKNCKWLFRTKRNPVNEVEFYPFQKVGFAVKVR